MLRIRDEVPGDEKSIEDVTTDAFRGMPYSDGTEATVVRKLREAGAMTVSLVAEDDGHIVGHVAMSPVRVSSGENHWYGLGPLSVAPPHQGEGIGTRLVRTSLDRLRAHGAHGCVVVGEPDFYARFGFAPNPGLVYAGVPPQYFMALAFGGSQPRGEVAYHPAFEAR